MCCAGVLMQPHRGGVPADSAVADISRVFHAAAPLDGRCSVIELSMSCAGRRLTPQEHYSGSTGPISTASWRYCLSARRGRSKQDLNPCPANLKGNPWPGNRGGRNADPSVPNWHRLSRAMCPAGRLRQDKGITDFRLFFTEWCCPFNISGPVSSPCDQGRSPPRSLPGPCRVHPCANRPHRG